jgi:membrane protein YqaA with SNARE-associated domain
MRLFGKLYDMTLGWARHRHAPRYLAVLSFTESSVFPIPPDVMLMPMVLARPERAMPLATLTTLSSVLGGLFGYLIGLLAIELALPAVEAAGYLGAYEVAQTWFVDYGFWVVVVAGFSPVPYKMFTLAAGALVLPIIPFLLASLVGRGSRFFLVAWLIGWGGPRFEPLLRRYIDWIGWGTVVLLLVAYLMLTR